METDSRWQTMKVRLHAALAALMMAGTAQGCVASAGPGYAWQTGGLDSLINSFLTPAPSSK